MAPTPRARLTAAATAWEGVSAHPHRFGGVEYRLAGRELGHIHGGDMALPAGSAMVDIPFPVKVRHELVAAGLAQPHHLLPETGWISFYVRQDEDVDAAIALLRRSYEIALAQRARGGGGRAASSPSASQPSD